jgi:hypothetical protein
MSRGLESGTNSLSISRDIFLWLRLHGRDTGPATASYDSRSKPIPQSPVLRPLASPLLHFRLPLALSGGSSRSTLGLSWDSPHARKTLPRASESGESQIRRVRGHGNPCIPRLVSDQSSENNAEPSPVRDVPHPFGQALGFQVLAGALQVAIVVSGTTDAFEPELDDESREVEDEPGEEATRRKDEVDQEEEGVYAEGDQVHAIEDSRVACSQCLESFLVWTKHVFEMSCMVLVAYLSHSGGLWPCLDRS